jgi:hypothetical protein
MSFYFNKGQNEQVGNGKGFPLTRVCLALQEQSAGPKKRNGLRRPSSKNLQGIIHRKKNLKKKPRLGNFCLLS